MHSYAFSMLSTSFVLASSTSRGNFLLFDRVCDIKLTGLVKDYSVCDFRVLINQDLTMRIMYLRHSIRITKDYTELYNIRTVATRDQLRWGRVDARIFL